MLTHYHQNPILGVYYFPPAAAGSDKIIARDLAEFATVGIGQVWLFFDRYFDQNALDQLRFLLDECVRAKLEVIPVLGQFLQLDDHPEVKIVNADGTTSDNPRYWNMGCFRQPKVFELAAQRSTGFMREFGRHSALYRVDGLPLMSFVHEAYYRNSVPEFGGGPMKPNCYCDHCRTAFRDYLTEQGLDPNIPAPTTPEDPVLWQHWLNCHAQAIPEFLARLIAATRAVQPLWATHECNDFYPASWQCVYTGNDFWRMGAVIDFGHEDMYPLEFDTRYQCYVYNYTKDVMRSAMGFNKLVTGNGQAFNSWLGYQLPANSMSEQIYSLLAHDALGLAWWTHLPGPDKTVSLETLSAEELERLADMRYEMIRQTAAVNAPYRELVRQLQGAQLAQAQIALVYSWTSMSQALNDNHTYDTLLTYMLLSQGGYPVDIVTEDQIAAGILDLRSYRALGVLGASALPEAARQAIETFVARGGLVLTDYAPAVNDSYPPLYPQWRGAAKSGHRIYTLPTQQPVPIQIEAGWLTPPPEAEIVARFEDGQPAICRMAQGAGSVILAGSYLGWDYTNYPGYYDLGAMFPFHIRQDAALREWLHGLLIDYGVLPPVHSSHPDVEVARWYHPGMDAYLVIVINHLQETVQTDITPDIDIQAQAWSLREAFTDQPLSFDGDTDSFAVELSPLEGCAYWLRPR